MGLSWEETETAALDRQEWHRSVAHNRCQGQLSWLCCWPYKYHFSVHSHARLFEVFCEQRSFSHRPWAIHVIVNIIIIISSSSSSITASSSNVNTGRRNGCVSCTCASRRYRWLTRAAQWWEWPAQWQLLLYLHQLSVTSCQPEAQSIIVLSTFTQIIVFKTVTAWSRTTKCTTL